jgi:hypothetical protein
MAMNRTIPGKSVVWKSQRISAALDSSEENNRLLLLLLLLLFDGVTIL